MSWFRRSGGRKTGVFDLLIKLVELEGKTKPGTINFFGMIFAGFTVVGLSAFKLAHPVISWIASIVDQVPPESGSSLLAALIAFMLFVLACAFGLAFVDQTDD